MSHYTTISEDTTGATIRERQYVYGDASTVIIESNDDGATITVGYKDQSGDFAAFPDGALSGSGCIVNHHAGAHGGVELMVSVSGITANPVVIKVTP